MSVEAMNYQTEMPNNQIPNKISEIKVRHLQALPENISPLDHVDFNQIKHSLDSKQKPTSIDVVVVAATQIGILPQELDEADREERQLAIHHVERAYEVYKVLFEQEGNTAKKRLTLNELTEDCDESPIIKALESVVYEAQDTDYITIARDAIRVARITMLIQCPDQTKLQTLLSTN